MGSDPVVGPARILVLEAGRRDAQYWRDLWLYRELFAILAWRDIAVRYKQTLVGVAWAVIRPFLTTLVLTVVFSRVARLPTEGDAPYPLLVLAGVLPWFLFATILSEAANSLVTNAQLVGKVYFPRIVLPLSAAVVSLVDLLVNLAAMAAVMLWFRFLPDWRVVVLPAFVVLAVLAALGPALLLAALNVKYRDFRHLIPFAVQFGLYISPVGFSSAHVPAQWALVYGLNPMVGVIDGFRWCLLGGQTALEPTSLVLSVAVSTFFLWYGGGVFRRTERSFADLI